MESFSSRTHDFLRLHDIDRAKFDADIRGYISSKLTEVSKADVDKLTSQSSGVWIYAATAVNYISDHNLLKDSRSRLSLMLAGSQDYSIRSKPLDRLYSAILSAAVTSNIEDTERREFECVLDTLVCAKEPLSVQSIAALHRMNQTRVKNIVSMLLSIYRMDGDSIPIIPLHASFGDYMRDRQRSGEDVASRLEKHHIYLAHCCFEVMNLHLKFNICNLPSSFLDDQDVIDLEVHKDEKLPMHLRYGCAAWAHHLRCTDRTLVSVFQRFISMYLLFWLEVMSLVGQGRECAAMRGIGAR
jgi:hypothetical protein